ncbi:MAG TPA: hypothetical protein VF992_00780 [Thermoplasmata archaeon]
MYCPGTPSLGRLRDDLGTILVVSCDACRSIRIDSADGRGSTWKITYIDPAIL